MVKPTTKTGAYAPVRDVCLDARHEERPARRLRPEPGVAESKLFPRVDVGVRFGARGAVELVDVRPILVRSEAAGLTGAVGGR